MMDVCVQIIMYHYVRELPMTRYPNIRGLKTSQFIAQLDFLTSQGAAFVSMEQVLEAAQGGSSLPNNSVLLTFDDGYLDHFTNVFPILNERKIPAFFSMPGKIIAEKKLLDVNRIHYTLASAPIHKLVARTFKLMDHYRGAEYPIPTNNELYANLAQKSRFDDADTIFLKRLLQVELPEQLRSKISQQLFEEYIGLPEERFVGELYMTLDQVRMMKRFGMTWGIHGYDHYWMNRLGAEKLEKDITKALDVFDGIVPSKGWVCCYPYGSVSDEVVEIVRPLGAVCGMTTEVRVAALSTDNIFRLPRLDTNDYPPKSENYLNFMHKGDY